jgi:hypothetical protein
MVPLVVLQDGELKKVSINPVPKIHKTQNSEA